MEHEKRKKMKAFSLPFRRGKHKRGKSVPSAASSPVYDITSAGSPVVSDEIVENHGVTSTAAPTQMHEVDRYLAAGSDLHLQIISGQGLLAMDGNGLSDPYCMVKMGDVSHRTSTMKETLLPVWNEVFLLHSEEVRKAEGIIKFQLWDADDWCKDDFLGQARLNLYNIAHTSQENQITLELKGSSSIFKDLGYQALAGSRSDRGTLTVAVWWTHSSTNLKHENETGTDPATPKLVFEKERYVSSLCTAPGLGKVIPTVITTKLGSLHEEPAINYICIQLNKVEIYADDTDVSHCPLKICCSAVSAFGKVLGGVRERTKVHFPNSILPFTYQAGPRKQQEKEKEESKIIAKLDGGSNFLDDWATDFDPAGLWNIAESTIPTYDSDQEGDPEGATKENDEEAEELVSEEDGTLHVKPYWHYKVGFAKQKHTSKSVYNDKDEHVDLEFTDKSIFVAVRPLKNRDITISLYTSPVPQLSSKRELLMKWKLDLFDLLDEKQGSWCASGSSGVKGRAYIKCTLIDPDVRSMLHKMPPRETNAGGRYQGIWGRRAEELTAAKVPIKDVSKSDETRFSRSDGSLLFRGQSFFSSLLSSYSFSSGKQSITEPVGESTPGEFHIEVQSVELEDPADCFCVLKCGPHWCKTIVHPATKTCIWEWQIKLPIYDPATLLAFAVFSEHRRQVIDKGRMRIRLCTLEPNRVYSSRLPITINGDVTGYVNLVMRAMYPEGYRLSPKYMQPELPKEIYMYGLHQYPMDRIVKKESTTILLRWLDGSRPRINNAVALKMLDLASDSFSRRRLRIHFQRIKHCLSIMNPILGYLDSIQSWENPYITIATLFMLCLVVYFPSHALFLGLLALGLLCSFMFQIPDTVPTMVDLPEPQESSQEEASKPKESANPYQALKGRYEQVQGILVRLQNVADGIASHMEKVEALLTWRDPTASRIFSLVVFLAAIAVKSLGIQFFLCFGIIWSLRPPCFKNPIPPPPINFLGRLPSRGDQVL